MPQQKPAPRPAVPARNKASPPPPRLSRAKEALHKGTDPAYPADEARASEPGREKPE